MCGNSTIKIDKTHVFRKLYLRENKGKQSLIILQCEYLRLIF